jgi:alpha-glucosidase
MRPHHDPSARYVDNPDPDPGDTVTVSVDLGDTAVSRSWLRTVVDGEQAWHEGVPDSSEPGRRLHFELPCNQPVVNYRFHLETDAGPRWLTGLGLIDWDPGDVHDFRLLTTGGPTTTEEVWYQIFPDRFATTGRHRDPDLPWAQWAEWSDPVVSGKPAMTQMYGGDLDGITDHLDHLVGLGVGGIYLTPVFPARSNHRYDATSFAHVDPVLGGDEALVRLAGEAHRRGIKVMTDLTLNHTGDHHEWFRAAQAQPASPEAGFYHLTDGGYESWLGVKSLPKLDHRSDELARRLHRGPGSVLGRYLRPPFDLDGWRIDVANMTGRLGYVDLNREVARAARATVDAASGDRPRWLVAEHFFDASLDAPGDGWHGVMNYAGVTRPIVSWLGRFETLGTFTAGPGQPPRNGVQMARAMDAVRAATPWAVTMRSMTLLSSHDTARWRSMATSDEVALVGFGLLMCLPGTPTFFYGDEIGLTGATSELARTPMPWDRAAWDHRFLDWFRRLVGVRNGHEALRVGGFRWVDVQPDAVTFLRESADQRLLVRAARAATGATTVGVGRAGRLHPVVGLDATDSIDVADGRATIIGDGPGFAVWQIE